MAVDFSVSEAISNSYLDISLRMEFLFCGFNLQKCPFFSRMWCKSRGEDICTNVYLWIRVVISKYRYARVATLIGIQVLNIWDAGNIQDGSTFRDERVLTEKSDSALNVADDMSLKAFQQGRKPVVTRESQTAEVA